MLTPFRGFWDTESEFDRMFDDMMRNFFAGHGREGVGVRTWAPPIEAFTKEGDLLIRAHLPGVTLEDVDITLDGNVLMISGERKAATEEGVNYYLAELPYGAFRRSVVVPEGIDPDSIKARLTNGVLEVVLPGAVQELQPKKIAIEGGESKSIEGGGSS